jgi:hypothetical protein
MKFYSNNSNSLEMERNMKSLGWTGNVPCFKMKEIILGKSLASRIDPKFIESKFISGLLKYELQM